MRGGKQGGREADSRWRMANGEWPEGRLMAMSHWPASSAMSHQPALKHAGMGSQKGELEAETRTGSPVSDGRVRRSVIEI